MFKSNLLERLFNNGNPIKDVKITPPCNNYFSFNNSNYLGTCNIDNELVNIYKCEFPKNCAKLNNNLNNIKNG